MTVTVNLWEDPTSWNQFVASTPNAHFQQSWEWGNLAPDLGGRAVRLAATENGSVIGAAQVFVNPVGRTGATQLYIPRGPAVLCPNLRTLGPIFDRVGLVGREANAIGVRIEPNAAEYSKPWKDSLEALSFRPSFPPTQPRSSWVLDITPPADELLAQMKQKTRYNIRLAVKKGVVVEEVGPEALDCFYELYLETAARDDFFIQPKAVYSRMFEAFSAAGNFCLLMASSSGQTIAAVTLVRFGETCWYLHGASSNGHRNLMAPYLLQWEAIQRAKGWGCRLYDFRAIPDVLRPDQDMYGVYRFKEGFGGRQFTTSHAWGHAYHPILSGLWQIYFRSRFELTAFRRRRKGLPARQFA